ncbi:MAG: hypothetical protein MHM6MM_000882 [Cercozoa sp. M6MM]
MSSRFSNIGRDDDEIRRVVHSIEEKPKFARLVEYSLNCLGSMMQNRFNAEPMIQSGGIGTIEMALNMHMGKPKLMEEAARVYKGMARAGEEYVLACGESGAINTALSYLDCDPHDCGTHACEVLESLCATDPPVDDNVTRLLEANGIARIIKALEQAPDNPDLAAVAVRLLNKLGAYNESIAKQINALGGGTAILNALQRFPDNAELARNAIEALVRLGRMDQATFDFLKSRGIVGATTRAMDMHPDDASLRLIGTSALETFGDLDDLRLALNSVSAAATGGITDYKLVGQAMGILSNMALIDKNREFILRQNGIPDMHAVVAQCVDVAVHDEDAADLVAAGVRGLGRLIKSEASAREFLEQGGIATLEDTLRKHKDNPKVTNAVADALMNLSATQAGHSAILTSADLIPLMVQVSVEHPEFVGYNNKAMQVFARLAASADGLQKAMDAGLMAACGAVLATSGDQGVLLRDMELLQSLLQHSADLTAESMAEYCVEPLISVLQDNPTDMLLVKNAMKVLGMLAQLNPAIADFIKEQGVQEAIDKVLEANIGNKTVKRLAMDLQKALKGSSSLTDTLRSVQSLVDAVLMNPNDLQLLAAFGEQLRTIASYTGDAKHLQTILNTGIMAKLPELFRAVGTLATKSDTQKNLLEDLALLALQMLQGDAKTRREFVESGALRALLESYTANPTYTQLADAVVEACKWLVQQDEDGDADEEQWLLQELFAAGAVPVLDEISSNNAELPELLADVARVLGRLAMDESHAERVGEEAGGALVTAVSATLDYAVQEASEEAKEMMLDSLLALTHVAEQGESAQFVVQNEGISVLTEVVKSFKKDEAVLMHVLDCLATLTSDPDFAVASANSQLIKRVLEAMRRNPEDESVVTYGLAFIDNSVDQCPEGTARALKAHRGVRTIADVITEDDNLERDAVQLYGLRSLAHAAVVHEEVCKETARAGVVEHALEMLREHADNADIAMAVTELLEALSRLPENLQTLVSEGAADALQWLLENYGDDSELLSLAEQALARIETGVVADRAIDRLVADLLASVETEDARHALQALLNYLGEHPDEVSSIEITQSLLDKLIEVFNDHRDDVVAVTQAVDLVQRLVLNNAQMAALLADMDNVEVLTTMLQAVTVPDACLQSAELNLLALAALRKLAADPGALQSLQQAATVEAILTMLSEHPDDAEVQKLGLEALNSIAKVDELEAARIAQLGGVETAFAALDTHKTDALVTNRAVTLIETLSRQTQGDLSALESVFGATRNAPENATAQAAGLQALALMARMSPELQGKLSQLGALEMAYTAMKQHPNNLKVLQAASALVDVFREQLETHAEPLDYSRMILGEMQGHPESAHIQAVSLQALAALAANAGVASFLGAETDAIQLAIDAMNQHPESADVALAAAQLLSKLSLDASLRGKLLELGALPVMQWAADAFPENASIQALAASLEQLLLAEEAKLVSEAPLQVSLTAEELIASSMAPPEEPVPLELSEEALILAAPPPPPVCEVDEAFLVDDEEFDLMLQAEDVDDPRGAISVLDDLTQDRETLLRAVQLLGENLADDALVQELMDQDAIIKLIQALNKFRDDPIMVAAIARALDRFAINEENITEIVANGGIAALLKALKRHMDVPDTLAAGVALLGNLATNDHLKALIGLQNGIKLIVKCMEMYPGDVPLLDKCCYCLANLVFDNGPNTRQLVELGGVPLVIDAMTRHYTMTELNDSGCMVLSNVCYNNNENKALVCKTGGARVIVNMIVTHHEHSKLMMTGFRALGNLAFLKENVSVIVREGAIQAIIRSMRSNPLEQDLLQLAMAVLGNLASSRDATCAEEIQQSDAVSAVLDASRAHTDNVALQMAALGCLGNLSGLGDNATRICRAKHGIQHVLKIMQSLDWDEKLVTVSLKLIGALANNEQNVERILAAKGPKAVVKTMRAQSEAPLLKLALNVLSRLAISNESSAAVARQGAIKAAIDAMAAYPSDMKLQIDAIRVLMNLSLMEDNAKVIAGNATVHVIKLMNDNVNDQVILQVAAGFLGNLAVFGEASEVMVSHGVCGVVLKAAKANLDFPNLLTKLIRMLSNMLMTTEGSAKQALIEKKGIKTVRGVQSLHPNNVALKKACETFIKKMTEIDKPKQQKQTVILSIRDQVPNVMRNMILSGSIMRKFCKSSAPRKRQIRISDDFEALLWEDPKNKKPPHSMPIQAITDVKVGASTMQLKRKMLGHKSAVPERSFAVYAVDSRKQPFTLNLEAKSVVEMERWVEALRLLMQLHAPSGFRAV